MELARSSSERITWTIDVIYIGVIVGNKANMLTQPIYAAGRHAFNILYNEATDLFRIVDFTPSVFSPELNGATESLLEQMAENMQVKPEDKLIAKPTEKSGLDQAIPLALQFILLVKIIIYLRLIETFKKNK
jgi:hypothetical protein